MHRFTDIESTSKRLPPVYGYLTHQLLPLQEALKPISSQVDQLDRFSRIAKNECKFPSEHGLTRDESAAIYLYTMEWGEDSFYKVINRYLRAEDRSTLQPWFGYLKLFDTAVQKLPTVRKNLWRGIAADIAKNFKNGHEFTWWAISSCSTSVNIIKDFLGSNSTLFLIEAVNGKDISGYTNFPKESEVILCPGTRLRVVSDPLDHAPMRVVHLQEISDEAEDQLTSSFDAMSVASSSEKKSIPTAITAKSSEVKTVTDQLGLLDEINEQSWGQWKDGKYNGKGKMNFANGEMYTGDWVDNNRTGQGLYIYTNGDRYEGQWKDDKMNGKGKMTYANSAVKDGMWSNSSFVG
ncbi:unnamed protein product [Rotaria magnacalcarata]|uniref:NAD(P)(+)--arginine ADP-ribosyltransferase n=2 Tax=Rotaria magnacalcarata TaxID=392030 RepID=A0A816QRE4_9BILA|nr:unnamed protein product [Rotaria magnacalcarata]CAF3752833.1 unnamed protein product [Rotaria magnacalcarata]